MCLLLVVGVSSAVAQDELPHYTPAAEQPIRVEAVTLGDSGELRVDVENVSGKEVSFFDFILAPTDCPPPGSVPLEIRLTYGDLSAIDRRSDTPTMPALLPEGVSTMVLPAATYRGLLENRVARGCRADLPPVLRLGNVAFCDGMGWEGFGTGPKPVTWSGRAWIPEGLPTNCSNIDRGTGPTPETDINYLGGYLGCHDLRLNMTVQDATAVMGPAFELRKPDVSPGCVAVTEFSLRGTDAYLCFSGFNEDDRLRSIFLRFDRYRSLSELVPGLKQAAPELVYQEHDPDVPEAENDKPLYVIENDADQGVLVGPTEGIYITFLPLSD
jgi:hypothetical protein